MTSIDSSSPLQRVIDFHQNEFDTAPADEKPFHREAVETLKLFADLVDRTIEGEELEATPAAFDVVLDLAGATQVEPDWMRVRLPHLPLAGENLVIDEVPFLVGARVYEYGREGFVCRLLVQRHSKIQAAPASALEVLGGRK